MHLLSTYGYDSYGLDISGSAVKEASNWVVGKLEEEKNSKPEHELSGWGQAHIVEGDFFHYDWYGERGIQTKGGFDLIYDYTVSFVEEGLFGPPVSSVVRISAEHQEITVPLCTSSSAPPPMGGQNGRTYRTTAWSPCVSRVSTLQTP